MLRKVSLLSGRFRVQCHTEDMHITCGGTRKREDTKWLVAGWVFGVVANARNSKGFFEGERVELTVMKTGWRVDV